MTRAPMPEAKKVIIDAIAAMVLPVSLMPAFRQYGSSPTGAAADWTWSRVELARCDLEELAWMIRAIKRTTPDA